jgi:hypothetical protein
MMGDTSIAAGSQGFTPPLGSGDYTFLFQQLGNITTYQFDFVVAATATNSAAIDGSGNLNVADTAGKDNAFSVNIGGTSIADATGGAPAG